MSIYFDNAATSWPKPKEVIRRMGRYFSHGGGNPGRSGHQKAIEAGRTVLACREMLSQLFTIDDPSRIIFTKNATEALNIVLFGMFNRAEGHLITTSMEHNSVLRPALELSKRGVRVDIIEGDLYGVVDPADIVRKITGDTKLVCINHGSNVTGTIQDIAAVTAGCRERGVPVLVDAAQTAGVLDINCKELGIDFLAASGHKGLLGPQGTGILYVRDASRSSEAGRGSGARGAEGKTDGPKPLLYGGTGSLSDKEEQPGFFPDKLESGTLNVIGIAGLSAGVEYILHTGIDVIRRREVELLELFLKELESIHGVTVLGPEKADKRTGAVSLLIDGLSSSEVGERLDTDFGIYTRVGLHCAPRAHKTIDTFPGGTVRFGLGPFTKKRDIMAAVKAVRIIAGTGAGR